MSWRSARLVGGVLLSFLLSGRAMAAEIRVAREGGLTGILVSGDLEYGDEAKFAEAARRLDDAVVLLDGPGGNLNAGMQIGRMIRSKGYATVAPGSCASACALAWLAGRKRFFSGSGRVGFHAAFRQASDGTLSVTSTGNALMGAYLSQLGMTQEAIIYLTAAAPESMGWMTLDEARRHGIEVGVLPGPADEPRARPVRTAAPPPVVGARRGRWTSFGEWVQAASRPRLSEAVEIGEATRRRNGNTSVFRLSTGWFVVVVGPFSPGRGTVALNALMDAGEVPEDSVVVRGDHFDDVAWGYVPTARSVLRQTGTR